MVPPPLCGMGDNGMTASQIVFNCGLCPATAAAATFWVLPTPGMILMRAKSIVDALAARTNLMVEEVPPPITAAAVWYPESRTALKVMSPVASEIGLLLNL